MTSNYDFLLQKFLPFLCVAGPLFIILLHMTSQNARDKTSSAIAHIIAFPSLLNRVLGKIKSLIYDSFITESYNLTGEIIEIYEEVVSNYERGDVVASRDPDLNSNSAALSFRLYPVLITKYFVTLKVLNEKVNLQIDLKSFYKLEQINGSSQSTSCLLTCKKYWFSKTVYVTDVNAP